MPLWYSGVTASAPRTTAHTGAIIMPQVRNDPGDSSASGEASQSALSAQIRTVRPAPRTRVAESVHHVDRTLVSLTHSDLSVAPNPGRVTARVAVVISRLPEGWG